MGRIISIILGLMCPLLAFSQQMETIDHIGTSEGLSQGQVTCLIQDRDGFIWIGTQNGLNRYDGYRFHIYTNDPYDSLSVSNNFISAICELGDYLLIGTVGGGLNLFDKKSEKFYRAPFAIHPLSGTMLPGNTVLNMLTDASHNIWLITGNYPEATIWLNKLEMPAHFWEGLRKNPSLVSSLKISSQETTPLFKSIISFVTRVDWLKYMGDPNHFGTYYGMGWGVMNQKTGLLDSLALPSALAYRFSNVEFCNNGCGSFWQTYEGDTWFSAKTGVWTKLPGKIPFVLYFNNAFVLARDTRSIGAYAMQNDPAHIDFSNPLWKVPATFDRLMVLFDKSGNFWWTDKANGLCRFSPAKQVFHHYYEGESFMLKPIVTPNGNIVTYNNKLDLFSTIKPEASLQLLHKIIVQNQIYHKTIHQDEKGIFWILGQQGEQTPLTLTKVDPGANRTQVWKFSIPASRYYYMTFDTTGALWFAAEGQLIRFDPKTETWTSSDFSALGILKSQIYSLKNTRDGAWWIGTDNGLIRATPKKTGPPFQFDFQLYRVNPKNRNSINCNVVSTLLVDPLKPDVLWIGTKGGGLNRLDIKQNQFIHITTRDGLPDNVVYGILPDAGGRLWISTNKGLARYDITSGVFKNYRKADGLLNDEYNTNVYSTCPNGDLLFGGINGIDVFNPLKIADNKHMPTIAITGLLINNSPVEMGGPDDILKENIAYCKSIELPYSKNSITLEFAALEFTAPTKNHYRYYLEGEENKWSHESNTPFCTYLNLSPGKHTFKVIGSNNDDIWSENTASLEIIILPPWYRSNLAYGCYAFFLYGLYFLYSKMKKQQQRLVSTIQEKTQDAERTAQALVSKQHEVEKTVQELETTRQEAERDRELSKHALEEFTQSLLEKNQQIERLLSQNKENINNPDELNKLYKSTLLTQADWEVFRSRFELAYPGFLKQLEVKYPELSPTELRLVLLAKMGITVASEVASILGVTPDAVHKSRHRLRKKLGVSDTTIDKLLFFD